MQFESKYTIFIQHDDVIKWEHILRYWPFVRSPAISPHNGKWRGTLMFSAPEQTVDYTIETPVIWDAITLVMKSL